MLNLTASLRYFAARLVHGDSPAIAPYLREGLGIEARARKLAVHWRPHLEASRAAQERWSTERGGRLTVLGAGRLLDFSRTLAGAFDRLRFVDADPLCTPFWRSAFPDGHEAVIDDVTGCLRDWTARLSGLKNRDLARTLDCVRNLRAAPFPAAPGWLRDSDAVLSLNLLSQIAVGWQDRVESHLMRRFGASFVERHEDEWLDAVKPGGRSLVEAHLTLLNGSGARRLLLITDLLYLEYQGLERNYSRRRWEAPPVRWQDGQWRNDSASPLECESYSALCGLDDPAALLPDYREMWRDQWLWHIRPQGTEPPAGTGSAHLVGAFAFENRRTL